MNSLMYILTFAGSLFMLFSFSGQNMNEKVIISRFTSAPMYIGSWTNDWSKADSIFFQNMQESDNKVTVKSLWNDHFLYFLFQVKDQDLQAYQTEKDHPLLYLDDMVEILLDPQNHKFNCWTTDDIVYHINLLGQKKDDRGTNTCESDPSWDGKAVYAILLDGTLNDSSDLDNGYTVEIAFPWDELDLIPQPEAKIGINFANGDNDGNGRQLFDWCGAWPLRSPHLFGTLILQKK